MHRYTDIDVVRVAGAIETVLDGFDAYVRQVATFVKSGESRETS